MCGICGVFDLDGRGDLTNERLVAMADTMVHRGPDDLGIYLSPTRRLGLGARRLSIVDLEGGHQPMSNEDGSVWVVFNGEIYNHADIRRELEARGHRYRTRADTEAILRGYEEWGDDVVAHLRGMFAFAVYDCRSDPGQGPSPRTGRLLLVRDRLGIKPLYYTHQRGRLMFASEIKAILAWPGIEREVDEVALGHYLSLSVSPAPRTMFRGISKLPPAHAMSVESDGRIECKRYWSPISPHYDLASATEEEIVGQLRDKLRESIQLRMMSDVPFGVFLSGGMDSSLNVALMSELMDRPVDTFSVAIQDDPASDERRHAQAVARRFGANHHEVVVTSQDFIDFLPQMVYHQDEPLNDPVCVPLYFVSKLARDNGTIVVQVGEGSDELFAGYTGYGIMADFHRRFYRPFSALPHWLKRTGAAVASHILPERRAEYVERASKGQELFWGGASVFSGDAKRRLLRDGIGDRLSDTYAEVVAPYYEEYDSVRPGMSFLDRVIYLELRHRLAELLLMRVDKMSMATSVEARVPYLDHELVEFAVAIPSSMKYSRGRTKHILKEAAAGILPPEVIDRKKTGFCGGASNMVSAPIVDYAQQVITGSDWLRSLVNVDVVQEMLGEHRSGRSDHGMAVWNLLNLAMWHRRWIEAR